MRARWMIGLGVAVIAVLGIAAPSSAARTSAATVATTPGLLYADDFDGPLDTNVWATTTPWNTAYTTGELEYYDPADVAFSQGNMHLITEARASNGRAFTSGIVTSLLQPMFSYGYFEIRAKLPKGRGVWPAFWLTNDRSLEIDVFEMLGDRPNRLYLTLHENGKQVFQRAYSGPDFSAGYHTYGVDWQPTYIRWYIDGVCRATYAHSIPGDPLWICLNTAVGGAWPGAPDGSTVFPQFFDIDYVRVYDRMPPNSLAAGDDAGVPVQTNAGQAAPGAAAKTQAQWSGLTASAPGASAGMSAAAAATAARQRWSPVALGFVAVCAGSVTVRASAAALLGGLDRVEMQLDSGAWTSTMQVSTSAVGTHRVSARVFDVSGREREVSEVITVESATPSGNAPEFTPVWQQGLRMLGMNS